MVKNKGPSQGNWNNIILLSPVPPSIQTAWKKYSDLQILSHRVEKSSISGTCQAIDTLAYNIAMDAYMCNRFQLSDDECEDWLRYRIEAMDNILTTIAASSGIHPNTIDICVGIRTDYYTDHIISTTRTHY